MAKKPTTLKEAMQMVLMEEEKNTSLKGSKRNKSWDRVGDEALTVHKNTSNLFSGDQNLKKKKLSSQKYKERKEKGLCFYCDKKFEKGHKCKNQKLYRLEIVAVDSEEEPDSKAEESEEEEEENEQSLVLTSSAMEGTFGVSSIRLVGKIYGKEIGFLIDSGAIHNFIDPIIVERLNLKVDEMRAYTVTVAGGEKFEGKRYCPDTPISLPSFDTKADLLIIPLGDSYVILGTVCLQSLGPTLWDFTSKTLKLWQESKPIILRGISPSAIELTRREKLDKLISIEGRAYAIQLQVDAVEASTEIEALPEDFQLLLQDYEDVFCIPKELPSQRVCDHHIT